MLEEIKRSMIMQHRDFFCPLTEKMLDFRSSEIIRIDDQLIIVDKSALKVLDKQLASYELIRSIDQL